MMDFKQNKDTFYHPKPNPQRAASAFTALALVSLTLVIGIGIFTVYKKIAHAEPETILKGIAPDPLDKYKDSITTQYMPDKDWQMFEKTWLAGQPETISKAALIVNIGDGEVLYNKNSQEKLKIASLTKIMTAILAMEHNKLSDTTTISSRAAKTGENTMGLTAGETYTIEELLYGLILNSGNDAAVALAEASAGDVETFVEWMNIKAKELGMTNSYFADPSGLNDSTYSTAQDLARMTRYALKFRELRKIAATVSYALPANEGHKYVPLENQTNLLTTYPGVKGFKTGYTEEAGLCLVTYAENNGVELVGVVLNSVDRKGDMVLMLDHAFNRYGISVDHQFKFE
ncbi:D-alanyl-D-alanine carboxypeptidase [Patescibacteria group bacterium]|nr:D-alanyl-D-alanine carboxypeptidase [Patescibacteria group bacterium]